MKRRFTPSRAWCGSTSESRCRSSVACRSSERIAQSIVARQPLIVRRGIDDNVRQFHHMAELIMNDEGARQRDCALDGPIRSTSRPRRCPPTSAATRASTPAIRSTGRRRWSCPTGVTAVRVRDVSESGAAVETATRLRVGDVGVLHLDQLRGHPSVPVLVKNIVVAVEPRRPRVHGAGARSRPDWWRRARAAAARPAS